MRMRRFLASLVLCVASAPAGARQPPSARAARRLLERAARASRAKGDVDFHAALRLSRLLARFDRPRSLALLRRGLREAKATADPAERLRRLEAVALHAAPIDRELSSRALVEIKPPPEARRHPVVRLKMLAIQLVLNYRLGGSDEAALLRQARDFRQRSPQVQKSDLVSDTAGAFADYVSLLEPELAVKAWQEAPSRRSWEARLRRAEDVIHYDAGRGAKLVRALVPDAPDDAARNRAAAALHKAGAADEALGVLRASRRVLVGGGQPIGDLISSVAAVDPNEALRIVGALPKGRPRRSGLNLAVAAVAPERPDLAMALARRLDVAWDRSHAAYLAVRAHVRRGDLDAARKLLGVVGRPEHRAVAQAALAAQARDRKGLARAMRAAAAADPYGRSLADVTALTVRALGVGETERILVETIPSLKGHWTGKRLYLLLDVVADLDPRWALDVFRRGPHARPRANETVSSHAASELLPKLAPFDPPCVAEYIEKHGEKQHAQSLNRLKIACALAVAGRSVGDAEAFAERVGVHKSNRFPVASRRDMERQRRIARIADAGPDVEKVLATLDLQDRWQRRNLVLEAAGRLVGGPNARFRNVEGVVALGGALSDRELAAKVLSVAATRLYRAGRKAEALRLVERIEQPWPRVETLCELAEGELDPRPVPRSSFLAGWPAPDGRREGANGR